MNDSLVSTYRRSVVFESGAEVLVGDQNDGPLAPEQDHVFLTQRLVENVKDLGDAISGTLRTAEGESASRPVRGDDLQLGLLSEPLVDLAQGTFSMRNSMPILSP